MDKKTLLPALAALLAAGAYLGYTKYQESKKKNILPNPSDVKKEKGTKINLF